MSDANFARAQVLLQQGRPALAEQELRKALAASPDDPGAHALLGICLAELDRLEEATQEARAAIVAAPDLAFAHYVHGSVLLRRDRYDEAGEAAAEALRLDPDDADHFALLAQVRMSERRWTEALSAADGGLEIDAAHVACANLRAAALVKLGRRAEAAATMEGALARAPEDAQTHSMQGWALLNAGDPKKALEHFKESLRLDPTSDWAKAGIVEALKARNVVYGLLLRYFLLMNRLSGKAQWAIVLGGFLGSRMLRTWAKADPRVAPFVMPIVYTYFAFALMTWIAVPLFNLMLRLHPMGKHALSSDQRKGANLVGACLGLSLASFGVFLATGRGEGLAVGVVFGLLLPAVASIYPCSAGWPRAVMVACAVALLAVGAMGFLGGMTALIGLFLLGAVGSQFLGNWLASVTPKR